MASDKHSTLGVISEAEIKLIEEHRANQHKLSGWRQGVQAVYNAFDNYLDLNGEAFANEFVTGEPLTKEAATRILNNRLRWVRADMKRAGDNYKIY